MQLRRPKFDFSKSPVHWARNSEFAQMINVSSVWLPYLERFLNRVMAKASNQLDPSDPRTPGLKEDITRNAEVPLQYQQILNENEVYAV